MTELKLVDRLSPWSLLNLKTILRQPRPELEFILPNLLRGSVGLVAGPGGVGKTNFLLQLGLELALGQPLLGGSFPAQRPRKVALVLAEESAEVMTCRLHDHLEAIRQSFGGAETAWRSAVELMMEQLSIIPAGGRNTTIVSHDDMASFDELVTVTSGADLIILDPIRRFHDGDENSSADMTRLVQQLEVLARRTQATVLAAHHMNKSAAFSEVGQVQQAARGSSALTDGVRWQANLLPVIDDITAKRYAITNDERASHVRLLLSKTNYGPHLPEILLRRTPEGSFVPANQAKAPGRTRNKSSTTSGKARYV